MEIAILILQTFTAIAVGLLVYDKKKLLEKKEHQTRRVTTDAYGYRDPLTGYRTNSKGMYLVRRPNEEYGVEDDEI